MLRRLLLGKGAPATYVSEQKPTSSIFSSRGGGGSFFATSVLHSSSDPTLLTSLFRSYGIREEDANVILRKYPRLRSSNVENTLRPKLDSLRSTGLTDADISQILLTNPHLLRYGCKTINFLKAILPSKDALSRVLKRTTSTPNIEANMEVLRHRGVPQTWILKLLVSTPRALCRTKDDFLAAVGHVEDLGLFPNNAGPYVRTLGVMSYSSRSTFLRKVEVYRQLGLTEDQVAAVIRKYPNAMKVSDDAIRKKTEFLRNKARCGTDWLFVYPQLLCRSLEKTIIPRCAVFSILMSKGLLKKDVSLPYRLLYTDERFFDEYVRRYEKEVPDVVDAFRGHIDFQGWDWFNDRDDMKKKKKKP